jgi:hypothetical protein
MSCDQTMSMLNEAHQAGQEAFDERRSFLDEVGSSNDNDNDNNNNNNNDNDNNCSTMMGDKIAHRKAIVPDSARSGQKGDWQIIFTLVLFVLLVHAAV